VRLAVLRRRRPDPGHPAARLPVGVTNPGIFYLASAVLGVVARLATGRASDRFGRATVAIPGFLLLSAVIGGLALTADAGTAAFILAGALHGVAAAAALPALQALVLDRSPADRRGMSSAAMGMAFDIGFGTGSILVGAVAGIAGPATALVATALAPLGSVALLVADSRRQERAPA
jgi:MFS family permease